MKFSVFTPTNDTAYIHQAYQSLLTQTFKDWEWVILPNNGADEAVKYMLPDPRVRVLPPVTSNKIGELKALACEACKGDYLVELDHDDWLVPDALDAIAAATRHPNDPGLIYSDSAHYHEDGKSQVFGPEHGWEHEDVVIDGKTYTVNKSFPVTPASLSQIFFAPDHVRVWNRRLYNAIGGHNKTMSVCDDQDLIIRTYLSGASFHHIPQCLYMYRLRTDGNNSYLARNAEIQKTQQKVSNQYIYPLIEEWCRRSQLKMLDLGGAFNKPTNFESVDILPNADYIVHLPQQKLPFADSSIGCVRASDFLEHVPHCPMSGCSHYECTVGLMNEIYRVLVPGGWLITATPSTDGRGAWQDPTHVSGWNPNSFWYYTRRAQAQFVPGIKARFQGTRVWQEFPSDWHRTHNIPYVYADLVALKGQRQPGVCEI